MKVGKKEGEGGNVWRGEGGDGCSRGRMMKGPFEGQMGMRFPNQYRPRGFCY